MVVPGIVSTPPTMTRPCSPAACASTASTTGPSRSRSGMVTPDVAVSIVLPAPLGVGELALDVTTRVALRDVAPPIVVLLAAGETELDLRAPPAGDVHPQRHDRLALRLGPAEQLVDLRPVQQQLAHALGLVVVAVALLEWRDMGADQPGLSVLDARIGIGQVHLARAERLDLGPGQHEAGLERLVDREFVAGSSVECDRLFRHRTPFLQQVLWRTHERRPVAGRRPGCSP